MGNLRNRLLKILLVLLVLGAALFGGCILYLAITDPIKQPYRQYFYPILLAIYLSAVPFFTGLFYGYRFLCQSDSTAQETGAVVQTLRKIKICAITYGILFLLVIPFWIDLAEADDAPGTLNSSKDCKIPTKEKAMPVKKMVGNITWDSCAASAAVSLS